MWGHCMEGEEAMALACQMPTERRGREDRVPTTLLSHERRRYETKRVLAYDRLGGCRGGRYSAWAGAREAGEGLCKSYQAIPLSGDPLP